jgi:hypothetical protein
MVSLTAVGQTDGTELTAFTDGCSSRRSSLVEAGVIAPPLLDGFHIALRLHPAETTAGTLPINTPERENAKTVIVTQIDRLHGRIWNGKAKDARITLERIRAVMPAFRGEQGGRQREPSSRRLWTALGEIDRYLSSQSAWLVNDAERHRAGLRVGTALTERQRQRPGQSSQEQIPADAMVATRRRSPAPGPRRRPQRHARIRRRTALRGRSQSRRRLGQGCLTPTRSTLPAQVGGGQPSCAGGGADRGATACTRAGLGRRRRSPEQT